MFQKGNRYPQDWTSAGSLSFQTTVINKQELDGLAFDWLKKCDLQQMNPEDTVIFANSGIL